MYQQQYDGSEFNAAFVRNLTTNPQKTAESSMGFIRDRIREGTFTDMIVPLESVKKGDPGVQVSTQHDTLVKIIELEPNSRAMALTFRGQPDAEFVTGQRVACGFFMISSLMFEMIEQELMAYTMPVTKLIEQMSLKDMVEVKDRTFIVHVDAAIEAMQEEANGGAVAFNTSTFNAGSVISVSKLKGAIALAQAANDFTVHAIQRPDIVRIKKLLKRNIVDGAGTIVRAGRLRPELMLACESDIDEFDGWTHEDLGDKLQSETMVNGFAYDKALGLRIVKTIKNDIVREGNIYVFTSAEFFGKNYMLNDVKFYVDKRANRIQWMAWMDVGMIIVNIASVVKLELYSGSVTTGATDTGFAVAIPVPVDNMSARNNKVREGLTFPHLELY